MWRIAACMLMICAGAAHAQGHDTCVDVKVGTAQSYACINQKLAEEAQAAQKSGGAVPLPPENQTGQFNEAATRNRLGTNFGKSVTPERPTANYPPAFASPK